MRVREREGRKREGGRVRESEGGKLEVIKKRKKIKGKFFLLLFFGVRSSPIIDMNI